MNNKNPFKGIRVEYHILQSFPVTCLNRDDVGAPKTAIVGGSIRARVSSQCWKRQVRMEMQKLGMTLGIRTKRLSVLIAEACVKLGANEEQAKACGDKLERIFVKPKEEKSGKNKKAKTNDADAPENEEHEMADESDENDTLVFLCPGEIKLLAKKFQEAGFKPDSVITAKDKTWKAEAKKQAKELEELLKRKPEPMDAIDIALFGRMVAKASELNVEAAASFAHAISTHKVSNEVEFFSALDDRPTEQGAGHLGSLEYNSATYYRYISLDLGQLWDTLGGKSIPETLEAFTKALFVAIPNARQATMSGACQWDFAKILMRNGQRLQLSFETAVKQESGGFLQPSIRSLKEELELKEKRAGSMFGKLTEHTFGTDTSSIDDLTETLKRCLSKVQKA